MKTIAFFNNKGGVGKTSLVYHLAWMYADLGVSTLAVDLDPQANLSGMFLDDDALAEIWDAGTDRRSVYASLRPLFDGTGDIAPAYVPCIESNLHVLVGDLALSQAEDELTTQWPDCLDRKPRAFRVVSAIWRLIENAVGQCGAEVVLIDVGPSLGAINRTALLSAQHVVVPLAPDVFSLQGLRNLGPTLGRWRGEWAERILRCPVPGLSLPTGEMRPAGYVVMQHAARLDRPTKAYGRWMTRIPEVYRTAVLKEPPPDPPLDPADDPQRLGALKHYRSLMPLAQDARKPMFFLKPADGALGSHAQAVEQCYRDFVDLALRIAAQCGFRMT